MAARESLLENIGRGGPLADLFCRASRELRAAIEQKLKSGVSPALLREVSSIAHQQLASGVAASPLVVLRQCGAGCSACCQTVCADVTPLEALIAAEYLQQSCNAAQLAAIRERLGENAARRAAMTTAERRNVRLRCGLLGDDGLCQAYAARPLVCAGVFSLSRTACETAATSPNLAEQAIPLDRPVKAWMMGLSGGLQRALVEAGLDGNLYELNSAVLCALETPDAARRWLAGEDVFADCICTDAHSPPRLPQKRRYDAAHATLSKSARKPQDAR
jgi:Fe-S-cluster containining protein